MASDEPGLRRLRVLVVIGINLLVAVLVALRQLDEALGAGDERDD
jgi:hypothetical protein